MGPPLRVPLQVLRGVLPPTLGREWAEGGGRVHPPPRSPWDDIPLGWSAFHGASPLKVLETEGHAASSAHSNLTNKLKRMSSDCQQVLERTSVGAPASPSSTSFHGTWSCRWLNTRKGSPQGSILPPNLPAGMGLRQFFWPRGPHSWLGTRTLPTSLVGLGGGGVGGYGGPLPSSYSTPWGTSLQPSDSSK